MAAAYSLDLRQRVMMHLEECRNKAATARLFKINPYTIANWCKRLRSGTLAANKSGPSIGSYKKLNPQDVCQYLEENKDSTLVELAEIFNVSHVAVWKVLRKSGYVNKKNTYVQRKGCKAQS